ncbi:MAG: hypothetical protein H0T75_13890 [Rhizobiales bacterium]|nr:hypothetical protein [Hyphomicrobiales bacterium]
MKAEAIATEPDKSRERRREQLRRRLAFDDSIRGHRDIGESSFAVKKPGSTYEGLK